MRPLTYLTMADWKMRGYGELLSGGTGEYNPKDACTGGDSPGLLDYKYGLILDNVLKEQTMSYSDLLDKNFSKEVAEKNFRNTRCGG
jgi:hypothetical protein